MNGQKLETLSEKQLKQKKKKKKKKGGAFSSVHNALSSNSSTSKGKKTQINKMVRISSQ
jgi:hypothetical protein